ncbi:IclR family transcriptional regulator [Niveispirillum fermenti]|uniref:IclR family transcriptional regulator n=1 Tax=Niveispirillum fermenti TaxID=1233113 RepID=UPI003A89CC0E
MADPVPGLLDKALTMLALIGREGTCSLARVAGELDLPLSTLHRLAQTLTARGYLIRLGRGRYCLGTAVLSLAGGRRLEDLLVDVGGPLVDDLARQCRASSHLGVFDGEMVTYLVKRSFGREKLFTAEGMQLEAYCSGIGKVLLAHLPVASRRTYLATGDLVALTPRTITDPGRLEHELAQVRERGWAMDDEEVLTGLRCVAVPVHDGAGGVCAALSVSAAVVRMPPDRVAELLPRLQATATAIRRHLFPQAG